LIKIYLFSIFAFQLWVTFTILLWLWLILFSSILIQSTITLLFLILVIISIISITSIASIPTSNYLLPWVIIFLYWLATTWAIITILIWLCLLITWLLTLLLTRFISFSIILYFDGITDSSRHCCQCLSYFTCPISFWNSLVEIQIGSA